MWLRKTRLLPGGAPGGFVWETDQDVVEVPDDLGLDLVAIPDAGFVEAQPPASTDSKKNEPVGEDPAEVVEAPSDDAETAAAQADDKVVEAPTTPKRGRPRKATQSEISE